MRRGVLWANRRQELLLVVAAVVVAVTMVTIAELAREDSDRHLRAQVLVERVRASGEELNAISAQALADTWAGNTEHPHLDPSVVTHGFAAWNALAAALRTLRSLEPGAETTTLQRDAAALFAAGVQTLRMARAGQLRAAMRNEEVRFRPVIDRLDVAAESAATRERAVAAGASRNAVAAFVGSIAVGLLALVLLGWRLQRLRRHTFLAAERRALESRSERRIRALLEHSNDVVTVIGPDLSTRWQATSVERVFGHDPASLVGQRVTAIIHPADQEHVEHFLAASLHLSRTHTTVARLRHAAGGWREVEIVADNRSEDPAVEGIVLSMRDVTERKALEDELRHRAFHDPLTGLANRALFEDRLSHAFAGAARLHRSFAVVFLDLDDFKRINDTLGHARGDDLLRAVASRISQILRPTDTAARLGGDEFALLIELLEVMEEAQVVARRILDALASPFLIGGHEVRISASIGVAVWSESGDVDSLLRHADIAMYAAKEQGKASIRTFEPTMHEHSPGRIELTERLRRAIQTNQFELDYQPDRGA